MEAPNLVCGACGTALGGTMLRSPDATNGGGLLIVCDGCLSELGIHSDAAREFSGLKRTTEKQKPPRYA